MSKAIENWIEEIKNGCDAFVEQYTKGSLSVADLLAFKEAVSCLNNLIAVEQELFFLEKVGRFQTAQNIDKPNSNGYDVYDKNNTPFIAAELKGMIPCLKNGNFGSQQREQIEKDLNGLSAGKQTAQGSVHGFQKYIVLFDKARDAMMNLLNNSAEFEWTNRNGKDYAKHTPTNGEIEIVYIDGAGDIPPSHYCMDFKKF